MAAGCAHQEERRRLEVDPRRDGFEPGSLRSVDLAHRDVVCHLQPRECDQQEGVTMKTRAVLIATGLFAATMTSAMAHADQQKHEKDFCAALAKFRG